MSRNTYQPRNRAFVIAGLGVSLLIAIFLSPFASSDPDGLDRVSQDHKFEDRATEDAPAQRLPSYAVFEEYALKGVPEGVATPLAGLIGTLAVFGLAWGLGRLVVRNSGSPNQGSYTDHSDQPPR